MPGLDHITFDENLLQEIADRFDLRRPNVEALEAVLKRIDSGDYTPLDHLILDLATGVGKTFIMAALIEYLNRQGSKHVMIVTPSRVVQDKTMQDFNEASDRYITGAINAPRLVTPDNVQNLKAQLASHSLFSQEGGSTLYIFNVQQLFPPKESAKNVADGTEAARRKTWKWQEESGSLIEHLVSLDDLVVIVDEAHLFGASAKIYRKALEAVQPAATIGLTASAAKTDDVVYRYPLWRAIREGFVKQPVLVYRKSGYDTEERQLQDALSLLRFKEAEYETWRLTHPDGKQTRPLLFVVCSNVTHATETAELLRTTGYVGDDIAVLQIDNKHNGPTEAAWLRNLDSPTSPVRVIVSVNKLREGWDTKRIAVLCTLRAMASEVLTQQVMGRGLRLPFGAITGRSGLDQLEIISHRSFVDLLESENVLREFGIEDAQETGGSTWEFLTSSVGGTRLLRTRYESHRGNALTGDGLDTIVHGNEDTAGFQSDTYAPPNVSSDAMSVTKPRASEGPRVGVRSLDDNESITNGLELAKPVIVSMNEAFAGTTFTFPATAMEKTVGAFDLAEITTPVIREAAENVTDTGEFLDRRKIIVEVDDAGQAELAAETLDRQEVPSFQQSTGEVQRELIRQVVGSGILPADYESTAQLSQRIVPQFMHFTGIEQWTEKAKASAVNELMTMMKAEKKKAEQITKTKTVVMPVVLPIETSFPLDLGKSVLKRLPEEAKTSARAGFVRREFYGPWRKGLFPAAAFDSFSAEYKLTELFDDDPKIVWWKRIYEHEGAQVAYTTRNNYIPDFVVLDSDGTHWIIEGKSEQGRDDEIVAAKGDAAAAAINRIVSHKSFQGQSWGYLIAFESDIRVADSFADLLVRARTERTIDY